MSLPLHGGAREGTDRLSPRCGNGVSLEAYLPSRSGSGKLIV